MPFTCEFCDKIFSLQGNMIKHQKSAKYCLNIQSERKDIKKTEKIVYKCEFCNKDLTSRANLTRHQSICLDKYKQENNKLTKIIHDKNEELRITNSKIIELELKLKTQRLEIENEIYKQDRNTIAEIAKQPRQINNTTQNNNKIIVTTPLDLSKGQLSSIIDDNLSEEHLTMGQKGIAHFAYNNFLKDDEGKLKYVCTDLSRQIFQFKNKEGDLEKDVRASKLTKALCDADIKQKSHQILSEYVMNGEESITTEYIKHYQNIRDMESDNSDFSKELTSLVV